MPASASALSFGKYRFVQPLDDTVVGEAHLATLVGIEGFKKPVVIRRVGVDLAPAMISEAKRAALLSHANIAHVLDFGVVDRTCFVVTEHVNGRTLEEVLQTGVKPAWPIVAHVGAEVAGALSYAHRRRSPGGELVGLVHRRLSAEHIVLSDAGGVKVTGFGSPWAWMPAGDCRSPEEARGEPVDGRADVFALGTILRRYLPEEGVPPALHDAIEDATHRYPEYRATAAELELALTRALHAAERPVTPEHIATLAEEPAFDTASQPKRSTTASLLQTAHELEAQGALFAAIERVELALESTRCATSTDTREMLALYGRLGRLCVRAHVGEPGATHMTRALDLADSLGRDDDAALFCRLRGELLAQANRRDESRDWFERAAGFGG